MNKLLNTLVDDVQTANVKLTQKEALFLLRCMKGTGRPFLDRLEREKHPRHQESKDRCIDLFERINKASHRAFKSALKKGDK